MAKTTITIDDARRQARILSKSDGIPHRQALDIVAAKAGYSHWGPYRQSLGVDAIVPGWGPDRSLIALPPQVAHLLSDVQVTALALNADGSAWVRRNADGREAWHLIDREQVDQAGELQSFMLDYPSVRHEPGRLRCVGTIQGLRFTFLIPSPNDPVFALLVRKTPAAVADGDRPTRFELVCGNGRDTVRKAAAIALSGLPRNARLVTLGIRPGEIDHPNQVDGFIPSQPGMGSVDHSLRQEADAFLIHAAEPEHAFAALHIAQSRMAPAVVVLDASADRAIEELGSMALYGSHQLGLRTQLAKIAFRLGENCNVRSLS